MARHLAYKRQGTAGEVGINMTPMIDCTFLLITFFILTSQMVSQSLVKLDLPRPEESQAIPSDRMKTPNKVIVNVLPLLGVTEEGEAASSFKTARYEIDGRAIAVGDVERLVEVFRARKERSGTKAARTDDFHVEIRADHRVRFGDVHPIMLAAAEAGIVNMNITALTGLSE